MKSVILVLAIVPATLSISSHANDLPDPLAAGWKGKAVCEKLHEDTQQRILRCTFPPKVGHEKHFHAPHFGYALSGGKMRLTSASGVRDAELVTGSSYTSEGTEWHHVVNIGETTVQYLIVEPKPLLKNESAENPVVNQ